MATAGVAWRLALHGVIIASCWAPLVAIAGVLMGFGINDLIQKASAGCPVPLGIWATTAGAAIALIALLQLIHLILTACSALAKGKREDDGEIDDPAAKGKASASPFSLMSLAQRLVGSQAQQPQQPPSASARAPSAKIEKQRSCITSRGDDKASKAEAVSLSASAAAKGRKRRMAAFVLTVMTVILVAFVTLWFLVGAVWVLPLRDNGLNNTGGGAPISNSDKCDQRLLSVSYYLILVALVAMAVVVFFCCVVGCCALVCSASLFALMREAVDCLLAQVGWIPTASSPPPPPPPSVPAPSTAMGTPTSAEADLPGKTPTPGTGGSLDEIAAAAAARHWSAMEQQRKQQSEARRRGDEWPLSSASEPLIAKGSAKTGGNSVGGSKDGAAGAADPHSSADGAGDAAFSRIARVVASPSFSAGVATAASYPEPRESSSSASASASSSLPSSTTSAVPTKTTTDAREQPTWSTGTPATHRPAGDSYI